jgi:hypothetical protein
MSTATLPTLRVSNVKAADTGLSFILHDFGEFLENLTVKVTLTGSAAGYSVKQVSSVSIQQPIYDNDLHFEVPFGNDKYNDQPTLDYKLELFTPWDCDLENSQPFQTIKGTVQVNKGHFKRAVIAGAYDLIVAPVSGDLYCIKKRNTVSGKVEINVRKQLAEDGRYGNFQNASIYKTPLSAIPYDVYYKFLIAQNGDLFLILKKKENNEYRMQMLSAKNSYQRIDWEGPLELPLTDTDVDWEFNITLTVPMLRTLIAYQKISAADEPQQIYKGIYGLPPNSNKYTFLLLGELS